MDESISISGWICSVFSSVIYKNNREREREREKNVVLSRRRRSQKKRDGVNRSTSKKEWDDSSVKGENRVCVCV